MASTIEISPEIANTLKICAQKQGVSIDTYLRLLLKKQEVAPYAKKNRLSLGEFQDLLNSISTEGNHQPSSYQGTYTRSDIYLKHD